MREQEKSKAKTMPMRGSAPRLKAKKSHNGTKSLLRKLDYKISIRGTGRNVLGPPNAGLSRLADKLEFLRFFDFKIAKRENRTYYHSGGSQCKTRTGHPQVQSLQECQFAVSCPQDKYGGSKSGVSQCKAYN